MDQLHAYAVASSLPATKCSVWSFFIGDHSRNQEIGKGKSENMISDNQEIGIGKENGKEIGNKFQEIRTVKKPPHNNQVERTAAAVMPFAYRGQIMSVLSQRSRRPVLPFTWALYGRSEIRDRNRKSEIKDQKRKISLRLLPKNGVDMKGWPI